MSPVPGTQVGTVAETWVFPVKSMAGASPAAVRLEEAGVAGDRAWAVTAADGSLVTAAEEPRLREVAPVVDGERLAAVRLPDGREADPTEAGSALSRWLDREVRLTAAAGGRGFVDVAPVHLVSRGGIAFASSPEHVAECTACDVREPRANLLLDLDAPDDAERDLVGAQLRIGGSLVRVVQHPDHCLGVYAEVVEPGVVAVGDPVVVES
jgi:hypothetical protein